MVKQQSAEARSAILREELAAVEHRLEAAAPAGSGRALARARAAAIDRAILALLAECPVHSGWTLAATGGYGRGELSPHSDVDLLMLTRRRDPAAEEVARPLFYALWDAGLETSPAVRSLAEALSLAARDLAAQTSCLQARFLTGDQALLEEFQRRALEDARRQGGVPFLRALLADVRRRHERCAEAAYGLEPDLKEGRGGLRDAHAIAWAGLVALGTPSLPDLARQGYVAEDEAAAVEAATDLILRVRQRLHRLTGRRTDRLYFAYQQEVASSLGYAAAGGRSAVEAFSRDLNAHTAAISWAADGFWERIEVRLHGNGRGRPAAQALALGPPDADVPAAPDAALHFFAEAARRGAQPSHRLARSLKAALAAARAPERWSEAARESLLEVLRAGEAADALLEVMAGCGLLSLYVPEWESIRYLAHHDEYHQHTVDRHSYLTVRQLGLLAAGRGVEGALAEAVAADLPDLDPLFVAGLLHDLGKGQPGDHCETGAALAAGLAERMGLPPEAGETVAFLVRHHLLLARTATRRDLDDDAVVRRLAGQVADPNRLRMLYLLTVADSLATGASAWTDWKAALVRDLFLRTLRALDGDGATDEASEAAVAARRAALRSALASDGEPAAVEDFLDAMPAAYLLAQPASAVREHFSLLSRPASGPVRVAARHLPGGSHDEIALAAADRPGLLWRVCGVFALHGVNVLEARAYTSARNDVLDVFRLADAFEPAIADEKRAAIVRDLGLVLEGRLSLSYRLGRKLRHYRPPRAEPTVLTRVAVDNAASAEYTVVEVHARDRLGLLYAISRTLSELQLDIHLAKVATRGPEAIDVFYVRDLYGRKIVDAEHLKEVERAILFELEEFGLEAKG